MFSRAQRFVQSPANELIHFHMTQSSPWYSQGPSPSPLFSSHSSSSAFYLHPSAHALASGPNLDETNGRNLDEWTDETNNYLLPKGSFFSGVLEDNLCWWSLTGLVEWGFMCPFHFHSARPCRSHLICCPANVSCGRHSRRSHGSAWLSASPWDLLELSEAIVNLMSCPESSHGPDV